MVNKIRQEYEDFLAETAKKTPQEIIDKAYEIAIKGDIVSIAETNLSFEEANRLSGIPYPLRYLYLEWLDIDCSHMSDLYVSVIESINTYEDN